MYVHVVSDNHGAKSFYEDFGFVVESEETAAFAAGLSRPAEDHPEEVGRRGRGVRGGGVAVMRSFAVDSLEVLSYIYNY